MMYLRQDYSISFDDYIPVYICYQLKVRLFDVYSSFLLNVSFILKYLYKSLLGWLLHYGLTSLFQKCFFCRQNAEPDMALEPTRTNYLFSLYLLPQRTTRQSDDFNVWVEYVIYSGFWEQVLKTYQVLVRK